MQYLSDRHALDDRHATDECFGGTAHPFDHRRAGMGGRIVKIVGVAAHFDATTEVTLNELRIELSYPLDQASDEFFRSAIA